MQTYIYPTLRIVIWFVLIHIPNTPQTPQFPQDAFLFTSEKPKDIRYDHTSRFSLIFLSTFISLLFSSNNEAIQLCAAAAIARGEILRLIEGAELVWKDKVLVLLQPEKV